MLSQSPTVRLHMSKLVAEVFCKELVTFVSDLRPNCYRIVHNSVQFLSFQSRLWVPCKFGCISTEVAYFSGVLYFSVTDARQVISFFAPRGN